MNTDVNEKAILEMEHQGNKLPARLLPVGEVARFLGVHSSTVRRWEKKGLLKSYTIGLRHNLRFKQEDILNFLRESREESVDGVSPNGVMYEERQRMKLERR